MKRRRFLKTSLGSTACLTAASCCPLLNETEIAASSKNVSRSTPKVFSNQTLRELKAQYHSDLFDDFLPFMERHVIDHELGGFMCNTDRNGVNFSQSKSSWFEGRGIWVYSFLYNNLAPEEEYLEVAHKSIDFILKTKPAEPDGLWPRAISRDGKPESPSAPQVYGDLFIAEGLAEYAKASDRMEYWDLAKQIVLKCVKIYDRTDYDPAIGRTYLGPDARLFPGARIQGVWMVLIRVATQMLRTKTDADLEQLAGRCVDAIMNYQYNPEFGLNNELINHDLSRPDNEYAQLVYTGHALETLWMVMDEAVRTRNKALFEETAERFRRHFEVAWDDVYGGVFRNLQHVDNNIWEVDKVLWAQEEVLIGALMIVEHSGLDWASGIFWKMYDYVMEHYPLKKHGYPLWNLAADRKATFEEQTTRVGNYHHPRHLMLNLLSLERMIERKGRTSGIFV
ncbi:MAG: AGE family epimerase/isomerase [bacterium]